MLSRNLEQTLHRALGLANDRRHEYATLEHLLLALADDTDAATVLRACGVDNDKLKRDLAEFLELTEAGDGVRIFIGSENKLFSLSGSSLVVSPYMNADRRIIGAVGVIGPTRLNYGRIVPIVDYTAQLVGRLMSGRGQG